MTSQVTTPDQYLDTLPDDRRTPIEVLRNTILANLPVGYEEGIGHGIITYYVPHSVCPDGYHCDPTQPVPFAALSGGRKKMSLHLFCVYVDAEAKERLVRDWRAAGHKLDMGASCVRFKKIDDVPLDVVGALIASLPVKHFLEQYEASVPESARHKRGKN
jgi:hypothetical protein